MAYYLPDQILTKMIAASGKTFTNSQTDAMFNAIRSGGAYSGIINEIQNARASDFTGTGELTLYSGTLSDGTWSEEGRMGRAQRSPSIFVGSRIH